jgi:hypothetical protein
MCGVDYQRYTKAEQETESTTTTHRVSSRSQNHGSSLNRGGLMAVRPSGTRVSPSTCPNATMCGLWSAMGGAIVDEDAAIVDAVLLVT